jgi:AcrR family transcriptional regulator
MQFGEWWASYFSPSNFLLRAGPQSQERPGAVLTNLLQLASRTVVASTKYSRRFSMAVESCNDRSRLGEAPEPNFGALMTHSSRIRDRAGKKQALIIAALKLFANKGYEATTTREIAAAAGCAEGLIHRYFDGKAGLLPALLEYRVSQEVADFTHHVQPAETFEDEYLQLVNWAVEHIWNDREFLKVAIPQALLDPGFGQVLRQVGPLQRARAISQRLRKFKECGALPEAEFDALVQSVSVIGFMFGFMRPAVLRQDRKTSARTATAIAELLVRNISLEPKGRPLALEEALLLS